MPGRGARCRAWQTSAHFVSSASSENGRLVLALNAAFLGGFICLGGDLVANVPEILIEEMLHPLMQNFDRSSHGADHPSPNDPLREFQMVETEEVHAFVEIQQPFGNVVQAEELVVATVE